MMGLEVFSFGADAWPAVCTIARRSGLPVREAADAVFVLHDSGPAPAPDVKGPWYTLEHEFVVEPGETKLPRAPITGKNAGERPVIEILERA